MSKKKRRPSWPPVTFSAAEVDQLYAARSVLSADIEKKIGVFMPVDVYFQDPKMAREHPELGFDECLAEWEPGLFDGPTSSRFAIVDYDGDTGTLRAPARLDDDVHDDGNDRAHDDGNDCAHDHGTRAYVDSEGRKVDQSLCDTAAFRQVSVWARLQRALRYFEDPRALGRQIPWGFDGHRLIVVPAAGQEQNAFYDRESKSLQFYYFPDRHGETIYTSLSADIVHHEFGHAVLDGIRPHLIESSSLETAAFHEAIGDITAVLLMLRNNVFRAFLVEQVGSDLDAAEQLSGIAQEFGEAVGDRSYLRSAANDEKISTVAESASAHHRSQVLTAAVFDIMVEISKVFSKKRDKTAKQALAYTSDRMQRTAIQPLDFLPPFDVTFADYARAVLRVEELNDPIDPFGYRDAMLDVFVYREILTPEEAAELRQPKYLIDRRHYDIFHPLERWSSSKGAAYRFLDDNRRSFGIPARCDIEVLDLYTARKFTRQARRLPEQIVLQFAWREELPMQGEDFGRFAGRRVSHLCGGTLVFDENGDELHRVLKGGVEAEPQRAEKTLQEIAARLACGDVAETPGSDIGFIGAHVAPLEVREQGGSIAFRLTPHLDLCALHDGPARRKGWDLSC